MNEAAIERLKQQRQEAIRDAAVYLPYIYDNPWRIVGRTDSGAEILEGTKYPNPTADNEKYLDALLRREVAEAQIQALLANVFEPAVDTV